MSALTEKQLMDYAGRHNLQISEDEVEAELAYASAALGLVRQLGELEHVPLPVRYPERDPGREPDEDEDPLNAIIRFCEVKGAESGPMAGVRVGVKDNIAVGGVPMGAARRRSSPFIPTEDAVVIERLLDAGATITAKTNMNIGGSEYGVTRNPLNPEFQAGSSSSGSAAAVAAGLVDVSIGTDVGGSIRGPAAVCGLIGMKATHGLVPSYGTVYIDHTFDCVGPITRTVIENARMLEVMAGGDWRDPQWVRADPTAEDYTVGLALSVDGLRVGMVIEALAHCTPGALAGFEHAHETLGSLGARVKTVSLPLWEHAGVIWFVAETYGLTAMAHSFGQGYGHLGRIDIERLAATAGLSLTEGPTLPAFPFGARTMPIIFEHVRDTARGVPFGHAQNLRLELRQQIDAVLNDFDVLITPTLPGGPQKVADQPTTPSYERHGGTGRGLAGWLKTMSTTCAVNLTGHPALTVPVGPGDDAIPTGLQIIGRRFDEAMVYRVGAAIEGR